MRNDRGSLERVVQGGPHLVLADLGGDDGVGKRRGDRADHRGRGEPAVAADLRQRMGPLPLVGLRAPTPRGPGAARCGRRSSRTSARVPDDGDLHGDVARDGGRVDVDVHHRGVRGELGEVPGGAVVEPGADGEQQVAVLHRRVRRVGAVHADHAEEPRVVAGQDADAHEGRDGGHVHRFLHLAERLRRARDVQRRRRGRRAASCAFASACAALRICRGWPSGRRGCTRGWRPCPAAAPSEASVSTSFGMSTSTGPGPAAAGDVEGLPDDPAEVLAVRDEVVVLGDRAGDADDVGLLEGVVADHVPRDLAGEDDEGHRVEVRRGEAGDRVGGARARS